jgi:hypothetical protein
MEVYSYIPRICYTVCCTGKQLTINENPYYWSNCLALIMHSNKFLRLNFRSNCFDLFMRGVTFCNNS